MGFVSRRKFTFLPEPRTVRTVNCDGFDRGTETASAWAHLLMSSSRQSALKDHLAKESCSRGRGKRAERCELFSSLNGLKKNKLLHFE